MECLLSLSLSHFLPLTQGMLSHKRERWDTDFSRDCYRKGLWQKKGRSGDVLLRMNSSQQKVYVPYTIAIQI
jgi:hypothetical protein